MAAGRYADQLVVIVGPTASGKSAAGMELARQFDGEIICADSRTVYKGLDIGTAKPSHSDQLEIPHHLLDVVEPNEAFSAAKFQTLANQAISEIHGRNNLPIMVGGTGLFVDGVLLNYTFGLPADAQFRQELEKLSIEELINYCKNSNITLPKSVLNKRHLIRAIEQKGLNESRNDKIRDDTIVVGIAPEKDVLQNRIRERAEQLFTQATYNEAQKVAQKYGWESAGMSGNIYPIIRRLLSRDITREQAIDLFCIADWQLARRQMTWFKRRDYIHWTKSSEEAVQYVGQKLANLS